MPFQVLRFEEFELHLDRYELRRAGRVVKLERMPMELLILLVERRGGLVTRQEIVNKFWGSDVFVDTEQSINSAMRKIRRVLRDNPEKPRFVQTVVGKGYRFVAEVAIEQEVAQAAPAKVLRISGGGTAGIAAPGPKSRTPPAPPVPQLEPVIIPKRPAGRRFRKWQIAGSAFAALLLAAFLLDRATSVQIPRIEGYFPVTQDGRKKAVRVGEIPMPLVSDGSHLYFSILISAGGFELAQVSVKGGETRVVATTLSSPVAHDYFPERSELLVGSPAPNTDAPLWLQPLPGGSPRRFRDLFARGANWSGDRKRIVYSTGSVLYTAASNGGDARTLLDLREAAGRQPYWPRWSPDGKIVRFSVFDAKTGSHSLWEIAADGTRLHPLLPGWHTPANECCGSWTSDGGNYVFVAQVLRSDIWTLPAKAGLFALGKPLPVQLTAGPISYSAPLPTRDGKLFAIGEQVRGELVQYDSKSGQFVPVVSGVSGAGADFSRDSESVAYVSFPEGSLWRCRADGSNRVQLTFSPLVVYLPRWSPDGKQILFYGAVPGESRKVYVVPAQGGSPRQLLPDGPLEQIDPSWSPDGTKVVFEGAPRAGRAPNSTKLLTLNVATGQTSVLPGSEGLVSPRWSPDNRYIAAMPHNSSALLLFDVADRKWTTLLQASIGYPNWSRDGKYIYFNRIAHAAGIARVRISDGEVELIASVRHQDRLWTLTSWHGLGPNDQPMLMRDISISEIYELARKHR
jgi:Tol biopolymer transport system component/DNA-binding winged helix-turn-helix (wHTH) protein